MPYKVAVQNEKHAALSDVLSKATENAQDGQTLGLTQGLNLYDAPETRINAVDAPTPDQAKAALDFVKQTMDQQLGAGTADRVLGRAALKDPNKIEVGELKAVSEQFQVELDALAEQLATPNNPVVQKWNAAANSGVVPESKDPQMDMQALLADEAVEWKVATSGSGGALIATLPNGTGAVVKIEGQEGVAKAGALSTALTGAFGGPGGYEVAAVTNESQNAAGKAALTAKVEAMKVENADNPSAMHHLNKHTASLAQDDVGVAKMNFVSGTQLNKLGLQDKLALLQTGQLAKEIGRAAALCPVIGLVDHAAPKETGLPTNLSNFLINEETGKIAPIDFDAKDLANGQHGAPKAGEGVQKLLELATEASQSRQSFENVVARMTEDYFSEVPNGTELAGALSSLSAVGNNEGLFSDVERKAVKTMISNDLGRQQAVGLLQGAVEGLQYLQQNEQNIKEGLAAANMGDPANLEKGFEAVRNVDFAKMRQDMERFSQGQSNKRSVRDMLQSAGSSIKQTVTEKLGIDAKSKLERAEKQLARRQDHVENLKERRTDLTQQLSSQNLSMEDRADLTKAAAKVDSALARNQAKVNKGQLDVAKLTMKAAHQGQSGGAKKGVAAAVG
ncbi:MAG: hypothetical protein ACO1TE_03315 [Prosthecobacter sp.]